MKKNRFIFFGGQRRTANKSSTWTADRCRDQIDTGDNLKAKIIHLRKLVFRFTLITKQTFSKNYPRKIKRQSNFLKRMQAGIIGSEQST